MFKKIVSITMALFMALSGLVLPDNLKTTSIPANAATYGDYKYSVLSDGTVDITDYTGSATELTIPSTINGKKVTSIGYKAFSYCYSLTSVTIPDSVTSIGDEAFYGCASLTSINVNANNKYYSSVDGVLFNKNKTELIQYPIGNKRNSYTIPDSVTSIGEGAFYYCESLTSINVITNNKYYSSVDGVLFNKNKTELIQYPIGNKRNSYTIPDSVKSIGDGAFEYCYDLISITIPDSVTSIGNSAFEDCYSLTYVTIGNGVTSIGELAFEDCDSLTSITIPDSVTSIGNSAFEDCYSLTSVTIGNSVTSIGEDAFYCCNSLTSVTIPDSVTSIGYDAFDVTPWLKNKQKENPLVIVNDILIDGRKCSGDITIPDSVTSIGAYAFEYCESLTSVTIPDSVTSIGDNAFYDCDNLTIKCYTNSTAHQYAKNNGIKYKLLSSISVSKPTTFKMALNSSSSVRLEWNKVSGANGYILEQYKSGKWIRVAKITSPSTVQYSVKGLASGTTYKFRMKAYKTISGNTVYSDYTNTLTTCTKPATPKNLKASAWTTSSVKLTWSKVTGANGYIIYKYDYSTKKTTRIGKTSATSFSVTGLPTGKKYKFSVKAYKTYNGTVYYGSASAIATATRPAPTTGLKVASRTRNTIKLKWNKSSNVTGYIVYMYNSSTKKWVVKATSNTTSATAYPISGLSRGKQYKFKVHTYILVGNQKIQSQKYQSITTTTKS